MVAEGERARDGDVWFRILNSDSQITRGKLNHGAFKGQIRKTKAEASRAWQSEMSGRLRSIAGTVDEIKKHATEYCAKQNRKFHGVAFSLCGSLRIAFGFEGITSAVHFTPIKDGKYADPAHADLTFAGKAIDPKSEDEERLLLRLHREFFVLYPDQMDGLLPKATPEPLTDRIKRMLGRSR
jgi:hypothetical protein